MRINKSIAIISLLLGGLLFGVTSASAADEEFNSTMTISPPLQKIVLLPGETFEGSIRVSNAATAKQNLEYSVSVGSYNLSKDENGNVDYNDSDVDTVTSYNQMMDWITLGKKEGSVAPNSVDTIPFTITVPQDAPAGGQYASIVIQDETKNDSSSGGNVAIENVLRFASAIFAEVAGETREDGVIIENSIPGFLFNNTLSATSVVKNNGNVHTNAQYILQVWPLFSNEEICTNEEEPATSIIMPETERLHMEECNLPSVGIFKAKQIVRIFGEELTTEKTVIVCPLWLLLLIVFIIVAIIIWVVTSSKSRKKR